MSQAFLFSGSKRHNCLLCSTLFYSSNKVMRERRTMKSSFCQRQISLSRCADAVAGNLSRRVMHIHPAGRKTHKRRHRHSFNWLGVVSSNMSSLIKAKWRHVWRMCASWSLSGHEWIGTCVSGYRLSCQEKLQSVAEESRANTDNLHCSMLIIDKAVWSILLSMCLSEVVMV